MVIRIASCFSKYVCLDCPVHYTKRKKNKEYLIYNYCSPAIRAEAFSFLIFEEFSVKPWHLAGNRLPFPMSRFGLDGNRLLRVVEKVYGLRVAGHGLDVITLYSLISIHEEVKVHSLRLGSTVLAFTYTLVEYKKTGTRLNISSFLSFSSLV
jgi:hypothetical protein